MKISAKYFKLTAKKKIFLIKSCVYKLYCHDIVDNIFFSIIKFINERSQRAVQIYLILRTGNYSRYLPIANIGRIMKKALPENAKIAKDAK